MLTTVVGAFGALSTFIAAVMADEVAAPKGDDGFWDEIFEPTKASDLCSAFRAAFNDLPDVEQAEDARVCLYVCLSVCDAVQCGAM